MSIRKVYGSPRPCIDYRGMNDVMRKDAYPLLRVDDDLEELEDANTYTHPNLTMSCVTADTHFPWKKRPQNSNDEYMNNAWQHIVTLQSSSQKNG
jgi:hypothetical protein